MQLSYPKIIPSPISVKSTKSFGFWHWLGLCTERYKNRLRKLSKVLCLGQFLVFKMHECLISAKKHGSKAYSDWFQGNANWLKNLFKISLISPVLYYYSFCFSPPLFLWAVFPYNFSHESSPALEEKTPWVSSFSFPVKETPCERDFCFTASMSRQANSDSPGSAT